MVTPEDQAQGGVLQHRRGLMGVYRIWICPLVFFMLSINNTLDSDQLSRIGCDDRMFIYLDSPGMVAYVV